MWQQQYGKILEPVSSFTRPANTTGYTTGQLMANNTTAASVVPLSWSLADSSPAANCFIRRAKIQHSNAVTFTGTLYLWSSSPTIAVGDGGTFSANVSGSANSLGQISFGSQNIYSDGASTHGTPVVGSEIAVGLTAPSTTIYGLLVCTSSYTPTSAETLSVMLEVYQNFQ